MTAKDVWSKISEKFGDPTFLRKFHGVAVFVWIVLIPPTLILWPESITWLALMSIWANIAAHWSAWQASRVEVKEDER